MSRKMIALSAACSMAASPCLAADFAQFNESGARRSGAGIGAYVEIPFGGPRGGRAQAGLRMTVSHDYRDARAPTAPVVRSNAFDLRLAGDRRPTLYMAGRPMTGEQARRSNLVGPTAGIIGVAVLVAAVVGGIVIYKAIDDSGDE
ncbi:MAG TPA: hypothetical protein VN231_08875 [Allosphingosinicella sp.]|nr:hypothetical protein [Allosphingosinicella sp.]